MTDRLYRNGNSAKTSTPFLKVAVKHNSVVTNLDNVHANKHNTAHSAF